MRRFMLWVHRAQNCITGEGTDRELALDERRTPRSFIRGQHKRPTTTLRILGVAANEEWGCQKE
jgi:hypothetical protein